MIQTSRPTSGPGARPESRLRLTAVLWGLAWRGLVVVLLPVILPSQAEIGAAQGESQRLMVGLVAGLVAVSLLGLPLGIWRRRGLLGSINRVVGAAVLVRLAFFGPMGLMMFAWMAALAVAVADWLYATGAGLTARRSGRRSPFVAPLAPPFAPAPVSAPAAAVPVYPQAVSAPVSVPVWVPVSARPHVPPPSRPNRSARPPHRFGRPVVAWFVALIGLLGLAILAWASNVNQNPQSSAPPPAAPATSQPQAPATPQAPAIDQPRSAPPAAEPSEEQSGRRTLFCAELGGSSVCVTAPVTHAVGRREG